MNSTPTLTSLRPEKAHIRQGSREVTSFGRGEVVLIGIGGSGSIPLLPSHNTGRAGAHPAVQKVEVHEASLGTPT